MAKTIWLVGHSQREYAKSMINVAPKGYVVKIHEPTRTDAQNRKLWPMIDDLRRQVPELATFSAEDMKLRFLHALGVELRFLPALEGAGAFPVGARSSTLTKTQFAALIELIYALGGKYGVQWSARSLDGFDDLRACQSDHPSP
jgi:hypothetical protein